MSFIQDKEHPSSIAADIRARIRAYIVDNLLLGADAELAEAASLIEAGVLDSTGAMELVGFLEQAFMISVSDAEIVPENLDSLDGIAAFVMRKIDARQDAA
jgi:acyl carrier protein